MQVQTFIQETYLENNSDCTGVNFENDVLEKVKKLNGETADPEEIQIKLGTVTIFAQPIRSQRKGTFYIE